MRHVIPYARTGMLDINAQTVCTWLNVDKFLETVNELPPHVEFPLLIEYLVEISGNLERAYQAMAETLMEQYAESYNGHVLAVKKVKERIMEFAPK